MRSLVKIGTLAVAALAVGAAFVGCSSSKKDIAQRPTSQTDDPGGGLTLDLQPVPGLNISSVHYRVSGGVGLGDAGIAAVEGDLPTPGTASSFSFGVPLRVGTGYQLSLTAQSDDPNDDITCTGGFGPFNVGPNQITDISLTLTCTDNTTGQVIGNVNVATTACPTLTVNYAVATPSSANVGSSIGVFSLATNNPAVPLTYQWSVANPIGNFTSATSKDTTFNCTAAGQNVLVTITANNGSCSKSLSTRVTCVNVTCGNGVNDPGEACDPSAPNPPPNCLPNCTLANCGNGTVEQPVETCEPPNTATCNATCTARTASCGDGFLTPPEACDPTANPTGAPPGATCNPNCTVAQAAACGDGIVQAGETCDNPGGNNYAIENCGDIWGASLTPPGGSADDCNPISNSACVACETAGSCVDFPTLGCALVTGVADAGTPAAGTPRSQLCNEVLDCVRDTHCASVNALDCYCGTASPNQCSAGGGNGACRANIERGLETTDPNAIVSRFTSLSLGGGLAMARIQCDAAECRTPCGI